MENSDWNWQPETPIDNNPLFEWLPQIGKIFTWYKAMWLKISEVTLMFVVALASWLYLMPTLAQFEVPDVGVVGLMLLRNFLIASIVAGGLHLFFNALKRQGNELRYDTTELGNQRRFTFNSQLLDNMYWTLVSGVTIWTAYEVLLFWGLANGYAPSLGWVGNEIWFCALFGLIFMWESLHFYLVHRLLHWPPLYKTVHSLHHRNISPISWSGISMHPVEHALYFSSILIHFVVPTHPMHVLFHMLAMTIGAIVGHTGFDGFSFNNKNRMALGHFHHQLHHRYFECNYGTIELPCDVWFDSFHDGTQGATERLREKQRERISSNKT